MTTTPRTQDPKARAAAIRARLHATEDARRRKAGEPTLAEARRQEWARDMAAAQGRPVLQGHADYCAEHGHADHITVDADGVESTSLWCGRCGTEVYNRRTELAPGQLVRMYPRHAVPFTAEVLDMEDGMVRLTARMPVSVDTFKGWTVIKAQASRWDRQALHQDTMARQRASLWA